MRARRLVIVGLALVMVAAACGDDAPGQESSTSTVTLASSSTTAPTTTTTTEPPPIDFTSDDGAVEVRVPNGVDVEVTIEVVAPEDYPPELASAAQNPNSRIYRLGPAGATFDEPVRVRRTIEIENIGDLGPNEIPVVYLMTRSEDGTYELLDNLQSMRTGSVVEVSGEATHFSELVTLYGQVRARLTFDDTHSVFATEEDTDFFVGVEFKDSDGNPLNAPAGLLSYAHSRSDFIETDDSGPMPSFTCTGLGETTPRIGFRVTLAAQYEAGQAGLVGPNALAPEIQQAEMLLKVAAPFECLDPATSILQPARLGAWVDHPGGDAGIPGEDFKGGLSGLFGYLQGAGAFDGSHVGLIGDANGNGIIDSNDAIYGMYSTGSGVQGQDFTLPLFGYGVYFFYALDGGSFSDLDGWGSSPAMSVEEALQWLSLRYDGPGRFDTSIGVFSVDGMMPLPIQVGPPEGGDEFDGEFIGFVPGFIVDF